MTDNIQILKKCIIKAEENGYSFNYWGVLKGLKYDYVDKEIQCTPYIKNGICDNGAPIAEMADYFSVYEIIFSHDFAKAFWGEEIKEFFFNSSMHGSLNFSYEYDPYKIFNKIKFSFNLPIYKYHLQQMVLEEEPLKYLEKFL